MARPTSRRRSPVSKALIELRRRLGESQESMAQKLGCALQSIARWETTSEPQSVTLWRLDIAREHHFDDLGKVFGEATDRFKQTDRREAEKIEMDVQRWGDIQAGLIELAEEGMNLSREGHPAGARIQEIALRVGGLATQARWWSWRNK